MVNNNISRLWKFACAPDTHDLRVNGTNQNSAQPNVVFFCCCVGISLGYTYRGVMTIMLLVSGSDSICCFGCGLITMNDYFRS